MKISRSKIHFLSCLAAILAVGTGCGEGTSVTHQFCYDHTTIAFSPAIEWRGPLEISIVGEGLDETCTLDFESGQTTCDTALELVSFPWPPDENVPVIQELRYIGLAVPHEELLVTLSSGGKQLYQERLLLEPKEAPCDDPEHSYRWSEIEIDAGLPAPPVIGAGGSGGAGGGPSSP